MNGKKKKKKHDEQPVNPGTWIYNGLTCLLNCIRTQPKQKKYKRNNYGAGHLTTPPAVKITLKISKD